MLEDVKFYLAVYHDPEISIPLLEHHEEAITYKVNGNDVILIRTNEVLYHTLIRGYEITSSRPEDILQFYYDVIKEIGNETVQLDFDIEHQGNTLSMNEHGEISLYLMKAESGEPFAYACVDDIAGIKFDNIEEFVTYYDVTMSIDKKHKPTGTQCCFRVPVDKAKDYLKFIEFSLGLIANNKSDIVRLSDKVRDSRQLRYDILSGKSNPSELRLT